MLVDQPRVIFVEQIPWQWMSLSTLLQVPSYAHGYCRQIFPMGDPPRVILVFQTQA